jgi:hypothetical protein
LIQNLLLHILKTIFVLNISSFLFIVFGIFTLAILLFYPLSSLADPQIIEIASDREEDGDEGEDEDFEEGNIIQICCAWNDALSDGILTYFIDSEHSSNKQEEAVRNGIEKWDTEIKVLELEESTGNNYDIKVWVSG